MSDQFQALVLDQADGKTVANLRELTNEDLPQGDVLVDISYSTLNYKDGLAITGAGKIIRNFPFVPGIDFAGTVVESQHQSFNPGDQVILTGFGVGERHWGGLAQRARVKGDWLVPVPNGLSMQHAMTIGTAGFTAMLCVMALEEQGVTPDKGEIVVTGAAGGVGSVALTLLSKRGYKAVASSGREELTDYLTNLGASRIVPRSTFSEVSKAPLSSAEWAGGIDTVGGDTLVGLLKGMNYGATVAACGLAGSASMNGTVLPFILRGVRLIGIDSVYYPIQKRVAAWQRLKEDLPHDLLDNMTTVIDLNQVVDTASNFLSGKVQGRMVVKVA